MNTNKPFLQSWLASSTDPTQVSAKVTGLILAASSTIIFIAEHLLHISLSTTDIVSLASGAGMTAGAIWFVFGLVRHAVVKVGTIGLKDEGFVRTTPGT